MIDTSMEYVLPRKSISEKWNLILRFFTRSLKARLQAPEVRYGNELMPDIQALVTSDYFLEESSRQRWLQDFRKTMNRVPPRVWKRHSAMLILLAHQAALAHRAGNRGIDCR